VIGEGKIEEGGFEGIFEPNLRNKTFRYCSADLSCLVELRV
jgi:hypothetical protein